MEELTKISGIGQATARKLVEAGIADRAALAAADPEKAPEGFAPEDWRKWIEAAVAAAATAEASKANAGADGQQKAVQPETPAIPDTKLAAPAKGPVCRVRVRYGGRYYDPGKPLPGDISADDITELKALDAIG